MNKSYEQIQCKRKYTGNKLMKRCSTSFVIRKIQVQTRCYYTPIRIAKIQEIDDNNCS